MNRIVKALPILLSISITLVVAISIYFSFHQDPSVATNKAQESTGTIKNILFVPSHREYRNIGSASSGKRQLHTVPDMYYTTVHIDAVQKDIIYESPVSPWGLYKTGNAVKVMYNKATTYTLTNGGIFIISIQKAKW